MLSAAHGALPSRCHRRRRALTLVSGNLSSDISIPGDSGGDVFEKTALKTETSPQCLTELTLPFCAKSSCAVERVIPARDADGAAVDVR